MWAYINSGFAIRDNGATGLGLYNSGGSIVSSLSLNGGNSYFNVTGGNVSIGTSSPGAKLEVNSGYSETYPTPGISKGSIHINPSGVNDESSSITFGANSGSVGNEWTSRYICTKLRGLRNKMSFATTDSYATGAQTRLLISQSGNVGIGTISPSYKLDVSGGAGIVGRFSGRVIGGNAVNNDEFTTLSQVNAIAGAAGVTSLNSLTGALNMRVLLTK
ncbi:MAG: hypothetical protein R3B12_01085 [Candidatus Saccharimonadales bacterium]